MDHEARIPSTAHRPLPVLAALVLLAVLGGCRGDDGATPTASPSPVAIPTVSEPGAPTETAAGTPTDTPDRQPPAGPRAETRTFTSGGRERTFRLYVPSTLPAGPAPLVVGLHGGFGSGEQFARTTRFDEQAEEGGFLAAYPDGTGVFRTWNAGRCCGFAAREEVDDVAFIEALIEEVSREFIVDPARVYAVGHSNGAMMALRLACESGLPWRAVGAVAGSLEVPACQPVGRPSAILIHGDADENHPLEGGQGPRSVAGVDFTSVADSMAVLAPALGCSTETSEVVSGAVTTTSWSGCPRGVALQLKVIAGGSHAWPGGRFGLGLGGEPSEELDATQALWDFFANLERVSSARGDLTGARLSAHP